MSWLRSLLLRLAPRRSAPSAPPGPVPAADPAAVVAALNAERSRAGLRPLAADHALDRVAAARAATVARTGVLSHAGAINQIESVHPNSWAGENLAEGPPTAPSIVAAWMGDPGHKANVLNPHYTLVGIGLAPSPHGLISAADFDGPA